MTNAVRAAIAGLGSYLPAQVISNQDLETLVDTTDEWIVQRTGIRPDQLELILCASISPETICPSTACFVHKDLGAGEAAALDISAACSGFVYGLAIGSKFIETGQYRNVLVIGAETLSRFTDYTDRGSCILFGDGAGAAVLQPASDGRGLLYNVLKGDGNGWDYIWTPAGGARTPASHETVDQRLHYLKLRGKEVYKFAVEKMQWLLADCMKACGLTPDDVDLVVPHQVNIRIIESAAARLKFPMEKVFVNIERYGNTSAASIPIALDEATRSGRLKPGMTVLLVAFGAGLTWAGAVVRF